jgi:CRISPR-associated protein Csm2
MAKEPVVLLKFKPSGRFAAIDEISYADFAEDVMKRREEYFRDLTATKLRNIYGLITNIYTKINEPADFERHAAEIQYLKVKMAYEAGREKVVKEFLIKTHLMTAVSRIKTYGQFLLYCRYAESLVAYFKFYGGKDS